MTAPLFSLFSPDVPATRPDEAPDPNAGAAFAKVLERTLGTGAPASGGPNEATALSDAEEDAETLEGVTWPLPAALAADLTSPVQSTPAQGLASTADPAETTGSDIEAEAAPVDGDRQLAATSASAPAHGATITTDSSSEASLAPTASPAIPDGSVASAAGEPDGESFDGRPVPANDAEGAKTPTPVRAAETLEAPTASSTTASDRTDQSTLSASIASDSTVDGAMDSPQEPEPSSTGRMPNASPAVDAADESTRADLGPAGTGSAGRAPSPEVAASPEVTASQRATVDPLADVDTATPSVRPTPSDASTGASSRAASPTPTPATDQAQADVAQMDVAQSPAGTEDAPTPARTPSSDPTQQPAPVTESPSTPAPETDVPDTPSPSPRQRQQAEEPAADAQPAVSASSNRSDASARERSGSDATTISSIESEADSLDTSVSGGGADGSDQSGADDAPPPPAELDVELAPEDLPEADRVMASSFRSADASPSGALRAPARSFPAATWSSLLVQQLDAAAETDAGWASLAVELGEGDGNLTVRARQDEGRMVVAVHLSDPAVRAAAQSQADEIRGRLEQHYGTSVDLAFEGGGDDQAPDERRAPERSTPHAETPRRMSERPSSPSTRPSLSRQEWIG